MKIIKRILLGLLVILFLAAAVVFVMITFYKKEMADVLIQNLKNKYALTLRVEDARVSFFSNWPHASIELKKVYLANDLYANKSEPLLKAGSISLSFNLKRLLQNQFIVNSVSIKNAEIKLIRNIDGSRNFDFKTQPPSALKTENKSPIRFEINKITIKNTHFDFTNRERKQKIDINFNNNIINLIPAQDGLKAQLKGELFVGGLLFNFRKGAFVRTTAVKTDLDFSVYYKSKMIVVHPTSCLTIKKQRYNISSMILLGTEKKLMLRIESKGVNFEQAKGLLTSKLQSVLNNFTVEKPFDVNALIIARLGAKEEPVLILNLNVLDNDIKIGHSMIPYSHVSFKGSIISLDSTHEKGDAERGKIVFKNITGNIYDHPFSAGITINNLTNPYIAIKAQLLVEAKKIEFKFAQDFILRGNCVAKIKYEGPTNKLNTKEFLSADMHLDANLFFNQFSYQEKNKPYVYTVKGTALVNNKDLRFDKLLVNTDGGEALLNGKAENFVSYVLGYGNRLKISLNAKTDYLNLNAFIQNKTEGLKASSKTAANADKKTKAEYKQSIKRSSDDKFEFNVKLFAKKLYVRKVEIENASIDLAAKNNLLNIKSLKAKTCDGSFAMKGTFFNMQKINAEVEMKDININRLFDEFENFGQKKVESRHLKGLVSVNASIKAELDDRVEIIPESFIGEVRLKLKDGHLQNFEPVQSMSNFIFKNRDFDNVTFSELNEKFKIRGYEMDIQELEIGSNILNLFVTGIYNFKTSSSINILIPWNNLKKRGKNYIPKSSGESIENSKGLKLNFSGPTENMKLSLGHKEIIRK